MPTQGSASPSLYTFGCMSLGSDLRLLEADIRIARVAMDAGVWFHASPTYNRGFTFMVLRMAFDEARHQVPPMIIKIRCGSARLLRFEVEDALRRLGLERIEVAQLVFIETGPGPLVHDFLEGGPIADTCAALKQAGKVGQFCPQCSVETSPVLLPLAQRRCFDGFVLYLNPLQRDADEALWGFLQEQGTPLWALRTLSGALGDPQRLGQALAQKPQDQQLQRAQRVARLVEDAGCADWTEFCLRYARSIPYLQTTIGGTANLHHLHRFLSVAQDARPLDPSVLAAVDAARQH